MRRVRDMAAISNCYPMKTRNDSQRENLQVGVDIKAARGGFIPRIRVPADYSVRRTVGKVTRNIGLFSSIDGAVD